MTTRQDKSPQDQQSSTRIVAGRAAPMWPLGFKIGIAAAVLALVGGAPPSPPP